MSSRSQWLLLLLLPLLIIMLLRCAQADPYWGDFSVGNCLHSGFRKHYARLWGAGAWHSSWDEKCRSTPAEIGPDKVYFDGADDCDYRWILGEVGVFHLRDTSCDPTWSYSASVDFKDYGCHGNGFRRFSSILWNIPGGSPDLLLARRSLRAIPGGNTDLLLARRSLWDDWCNETPATIRGVVIPKPTRCYRYWFHEWGDFDFVDPCCVASRFGELTHAQQPFIDGGGQCAKDGPAFPNPGGIANFSEAIMAFNDPLESAGSFIDGGQCARDGPAFPNPGGIANFSAAIMAFNSGVDPLEIAGFLWDNLFRVFTSGSTAAVMNYFVVEYPSPHQLRFQDSHEGEGLYAMVRGLVIPTVPGRQLVDNAGPFPSGTFATVDLAHPGDARILCTATLTGCCMAFGWDNSNGRLHIGHAQPDDNIPAISDRANMCNYLRRHGRFEGVSTDHIEFLGAEAPWGYAGYTANVIGFITQTHIYIIAQIINRQNWEVVGGKMMPFFRH